MTKDILFSPISRAPSIWIAFAEIAAVPVLFESNIFHTFFYLHGENPIENNVVFQDKPYWKQSIHSGTEKMNTVHFNIRQESKATENTSTTENRKRNKH